MDIREFPNLCQSLGLAGVDRIALHQRNPYTPKTKRVRVVENPHRERLMWQRFGQDPSVDDILSGICRLDYGTEQGLNPTRLFTLLASAKRISSELIEDALALQSRQARRYMAATKLAITQLTRHYATQPEESNDRIEMCQV